MKELTDLQLIRKIKMGDKEAMEEVFRRYYDLVYASVFRILPRKMIAEDIAQDLFFAVWKMRNSLKITSTLPGYLKKGAVNRTLNFIRDKQILESVDDHFPRLEDGSSSISDQMEAMELQGKINFLIDQLPPKCRAIFMLSRFEALSYKEIAAKLDISVKTVENQISKALKFMREQLKDDI